MAKRAKPKKDKFKESKAIEILEKRNKQNKEKENLNLPVIYQGLMTCKACGGAITASKVRKQQKNGNKHEYVYYHCSKRKDKKCPQKSYPLNQKDLEPQILGFLKDITIVPEVYNWAMQEAKIKKTKNYDLKEKILKTHKQNLVRAKNKIQNLIDMLADKDISRKEYAERRKKCEIEEAKAEEAITKIEDKERKRKEDIKKTYELMTNLKNKFKKGTPERKKEIIIKLGSNLSLENKKLVIMPDLKVQAFQKHAKGANFEIARFKPLEMPINKAKNTHREGAFSTWSE